MDDVRGKLETVTGKLIDILNPNPDQIDIKDIAWSLSRIPRFAAHTISEIPYNVAQHSIFVAHEVEMMYNFEYDSEFPPNKEIISCINECKYNLNISISEIMLKGLLHDCAEAYIGDLPSPVKKCDILKNVIKTIEENLIMAIFDALNIKHTTEQEERIIKYADHIAQKIEAYAFLQSRGQHWNWLPQLSLSKLQSFEQPIPSIKAYSEFLSLFNKLIKQLGD